MKRGEIAIGCRLRRRPDDSTRACGVRVNPPKAEMMTFEPENKTIVPAEY